jgi:hypothetical protein
MEVEEGLPICEERERSARGRRRAEKRQRLTRLGNESVHTRIYARLNLRRPGIPTQPNDPRPGPSHRFLPLPNDPCRRQSIHHGHLHVHDTQVDLALCVVGHDVDAFLTVDGEEDRGGAGYLELSFEDFAVDGVVLVR